MSFFAVIALKDGVAAVDEAVGKIPADRCYKLEPGKWIVNSDASTARELSIELGLREKQTHLVLSLRGYSGRAQPDLWEWLAAQSEKING